MSGCAAGDDLIAAVRAGNVSEAARLLGEGAPVAWKAAVSTSASPSLPAVVGRRATPAVPGAARPARGGCHDGAGPASAAFEQAALERNSRKLE